MKKLFAIIFACILFTNANSQTQKYHRVKIYVGENGLANLAQKGVTVDHGEYKQGYSFTSEFSDAELTIIKKSGLKYETLIEDVSAYYANQNNNIDKIASASTSCTDCPSFQTPANFSLGSMGGFFTLQEMLNNLDSMAAKYPNLITVRDTISSDTTYEGRHLYFVKISDNPNTSEAEPQVLYTALHHAREPESLSQLIFYMWYLLENYNTNPEVKYLVDNLEIYFVPCINPDGYTYNYSTNPTGGGMWRKNRKPNGDGTFGVDLNRNYGWQFGFDNTGSSPTSSTDTYRGPSGFSESETQMMKKFCNAHTFKLAINNHTYSNVIVYPWGYQAGFETPDSLTIRAFANKLTHCSGFGSGTADQTVGYTANGVSDDWMYGEQISKPMIYAMTPEAGSQADGFYPLQANIIPIAKVTMDQNFYASRLVATFAEIKNKNDQFITAMSGYINYNIQRLGLTPGVFTVSVTPVSANIQSVGAPIVYNAMTELQSLNDSITYTLSPGINPGDVVKYLINVNNGSYSRSDTVTRVYGTPVIAFADNCNATTAWVPGGWGISTTQFVSATGSITDSPVGQYANNANKFVTTTTNINLTDALAAELSFYAKWDVEKGWDYTEVMASTNGTLYTPLCGKYTHVGNANQDNGQPLYDGTQSTWVKESIDLGAYIGQNIKLRFRLVSDGGTTGDGFYYDDLAVKKIVNPTGIKEDQQQLFSLSQNMPNPCYDYTYINYSITDKTQNYTLQVFNGLGENVMSQKINTQQNSLALSTSALESGVYFYQITSNNYRSAAFRMVVVK